MRSACPKCGSNWMVVDGGTMRGVRLLAGLTLEEVSEEGKCSVAYVSAVERGSRICSDELFEVYRRLERRLR